MRPRYITAMRSAMFQAKPRSWVTTSTARPVSSTRLRSRARISPRIEASRLATGSSARRSDGSLRRNHPDVSFPDVGDVVAVRRPGRGGVLPEGRELAMGGETGGMPTGDRDDPDVGHVPIQDEGDGRPVGRDGQV